MLLAEGTAQNDVIDAVWPLSTNREVPLLQSHSLTVESREHEATNLGGHEKAVKGVEWGTDLSSRDKTE